MSLFSAKNNPYNLRNALVCEINCQIILRKENPLYIPKTTFMNGQGGYLFVSVLKLFPFKECTYVKKVLKICYNIMLLLLLILVLLLLLLLLFSLISLFRSVVIYFFIILFIQICNYDF